MALMYKDVEKLKGVVKLIKAGQKHPSRIVTEDGEYTLEQFTAILLVDLIDDVSSMSSEDY